MIFSRFHFFVTSARRSAFLFDLLYLILFFLSTVPPSRLQQQNKNANFTHKKVEQQTKKDFFFSLSFRFFFISFLSLVSSLFSHRLAPCLPSTRIISRSALSASALVSGREEEERTGAGGRGEFEEEEVFEEVFEEEEEGLEEEEEKPEGAFIVLLLLGLTSSAPE